MKLAILDDYVGVAAPKFSSLSSRIEVVSFPETLNVNVSTQREALVRRLKPFTIISSMRERTAFPRDLISELPSLKLLLTTGTRNAAIDLEACKERGIIVAGATGETSKTKKPPGYNATTEHIWALILGLAKNIVRDDVAVKNGGWQSGMVTGLAGKTLALLGFGKLGTQTAKTAVYGFGMRVTAWSRSLTQEQADEKAEAVGLPKGSYKVVGSKKELFETADVLSVHYKLSERSRGVVGEQELRSMKKQALLVNTSRGPLIDERALLRVLKEGEIRGAALDVFDVEPLEQNSEWRSMKWGENGSSHVLLTPHMGYVEEEVMNAFYEETARNVERWLNGEDVGPLLDDS